MPWSSPSVPCSTPACRATAWIAMIVLSKCSTRKCSTRRSMSGARVVAGGARQGAIYSPTIVADVKPDMRIFCDELFGPAVGVTRFDTIDEAIALANDTIYGLAAGIFTENLEWAMRFAREVEAGNLMINWGPQWRADLMPYGGLKESGFGKEGPRYAIEEMTELKLVCFHLKGE